MTLVASSIPLIDKFDTFELVRDQIAAILLVERDRQVQLATDAGKDPALWDFGVYRERINPWEDYLNDPENTRPLVNVWFESSNTDAKASNRNSDQTMDAVYYVDCYANGYSEEVPGGGHIAGDEVAALTAHRVTRLARNILFSGPYTSLALDKRLCGGRRVSSISAMQPDSSISSVQSLAAIRIRLEVRLLEQGPLEPTDLWEYMALSVKSLNTGELYFSLERETPPGEG